MNEFLQLIRLMKINERVVIAPREWNVRAIKEWFEETTEEEFIEGQTLQLDDFAGKSAAAQTWAQKLVARGTQFDVSDLPVFLDS